MYIGVDFDARYPWQFQAQIAVVKTIFTENPELLSEKILKKNYVNFVNQLCMLIFDRNMVAS